MMFSLAAFQLAIFFLFLQPTDGLSYIMEQYNFTYSLSDILEEASAGSLLQCARRCSYFNECIAVEQKDELSMCAILKSVTEISEIADTQQYRIKQQCSNDVNPQTDTCGGHDLVTITECSALNVEHGTVSGDSLTVGSEVHVDCDEGFMTTSGPNVTVVSVCRSDGTFAPIQCFQVTCMKISESLKNVTGAYKSYDTGSGQIVDIFCDFYPEDNIGYTFLSKTTLHHVTSLSNHYNRLDHVDLRHYRTDVNEQFSSKLAVLLTYRDQYPNVSVFLNAHQDFVGPRQDAHTPYLYIGFIPVSFGDFSATDQGYACNDESITFTNCDGNPANYIVVYQNMNGSGEKGNCCVSQSITTAWKTHGTDISPSHNIPGMLFYDTYEILMGGCGGLAISNVADIGGVIFGLAFNY